MPTHTSITIAYGDGIGPEIMQATLEILTAANARITTDVIEVGEKIYLSGQTSGIPDSAWQTLKKNKVLLKGPITTPQGGGYKSLNVTIRKTLGLYANVRPCSSYAPFIATHCPGMNLVIVRENEEDLYSGVEHRVTDEMYECLKLVTRPGCERIVQYAFDYARQFNRKKVTCFSKDNIMKMTDGLFHRVFDEIAANYPDIAHDHYIVDIGTALLATQPERFDVIVTLNLYGDIISDVAAQVAGSVGLAGSANIGKNMAMFEAIHGSAPDIAGKDIANPSGLLNGAIQMLVHINQPDVAALIENAWLTTLEDGIHTADIFTPQHSQKKVGTKAFAEAVIARLGKVPTHFRAAKYATNHDQPKAPAPILREHTPSEKKLIGVDIFLDNRANLSADEIAARVEKLSDKLKLIAITSRGLKIWPNSTSIEPYTKHCCCRFQSSDDLKKLSAIDSSTIINLLQHLQKAFFEVVKTENLYTYDDELGFSLAQGQ